MCVPENRRNRAVAEPVAELGDMRAQWKKYLEEKSQSSMELSSRAKELGLEPTVIVEDERNFDVLKSGLKDVGEVLDEPITLETADEILRNLEVIASSKNVNIGITASIDADSISKWMKMFSYQNNTKELWFGVIKEEGRLRLVRLKTRQLIPSNTVVGREAFLTKIRTVFTPEEYTKTRSRRPELSKHDQLRVISVAQSVLHDVYCNLIQKASIYGISPLVKLESLQRLVSNSPTGLAELEFHQEMSKLFLSLKDLHTLYLLPAPWTNYMAVLPFYLEVGYETKDGKQRRIVLKPVPPIAPSFFGDNYIWHINRLFWMQSVGVYAHIAVLLVCGMTLYISLDFSSSLEVITLRCSNVQFFKDSALA